MYIVKCTYISDLVVNSTYVGIMHFSMCFGSKYTVNIM
jgi:hypothetical protein